MNRKKYAVELFNSGFNCSQAVLSAFCDEFNMSKEAALKISTGFGGGMRRGEVCGAVSGAIMAIGLQAGHFIQEDAETKGKSYELVKEFESRFEENNGSIICRALLKYDLSLEEELAIIKEKALFNSVCPKLIENAIDIVEDMLQLKD